MLEFIDFAILVFFSALISIPLFFLILKLLGFRFPGRGARGRGYPYKPKKTETIAPELEGEQVNLLIKIPLEVYNTLQGEAGDQGLTLEQYLSLKIATLEKTKPLLEAK